MMNRGVMFLTLLQWTPKGLQCKETEKELIKEATWTLNSTGTQMVSLGSRTKYTATVFSSSPVREQLHKAGKR